MSSDSLDGVGEFAGLDMTLDSGELHNKFCTGKTGELRRLANESSGELTRTELGGDACDCGLAAAKGQVVSLGISIVIGEFKVKLASRGLTYWMIVGLCWY